MKILMSLSRRRSERGTFILEPVHYGLSVYGAPLLYFPAQIEVENAGLIIAGTHGDETASIMALSCALRTLTKNQQKHHIILSINPDGNQLGTRSNANSVDLNRNFPTQNQLNEDTVYRWNSTADVRDVVIKTSNGLLEPEIDALLRLIDELNPRFTISFHEPLACIDDPDLSKLAYWLSNTFDLPVVEDIGYETPGSYGTWCKEKQLPCVTVELPPISPDEASERYLVPLTQLLCTSTDELLR